MNSNIIFNVLALSIALASVETLHGIFRAAVLVPRIGKNKALKVAIFTGSILAFLVCLYFVPKIGIYSPLALLGIGFVTSVFMASYDLILAKIVLKRSFSKSLTESNPKNGNYLLYGLLLLVIYPNIVMIIYH